MHILKPSLMYQCSLPMSWIYAFPGDERFPHAPRDACFPTHITKATNGYKS